MPRNDNRKPKSNLLPGTNIPIIGQRMIVDNVFEEWWEDHYKKYKFTEDMKPNIKIAFLDGIANAESMLGRLILHDKPLTLLLSQIVPKGVKG